MNAGRQVARSTVQSVERTCEVLDALLLRGGRAGLQHLAADTDLPTATVHRLCATLTELGYLRRDGTRDYLLGPRLQRLGAYAERTTLSWAEPLLAELVAGTGETANLAAREGDGVVYLAQVPSPHSMRMFTEVGRRVEVHCTAVGKALTAELPDERVRALLERTGMRGHTGSTLTDVDDYLRELRLVRRRGYATDESEQEEGVRCVAVASGTGRSAVAFSVSGPEARFTEDRRDAAVEVIRATLRRLPD